MNMTELMVVNECFHRSTSLLVWYPKSDRAGSCHSALSLADAKQIRDAAKQYLHEARWRYLIMLYMRRAITCERPWLIPPWWFVDV
jgi:hypothetical protein